MGVNLFAEDIKCVINTVNRCMGFAFSLCLPALKVLDYYLKCPVWTYNQCAGYDMSGGSITFLTLVSTVKDIFFIEVQLPRKWNNFANCKARILCLIKLYPKLVL